MKRYIHYTSLGIMLLVAFAFLLHTVYQWVDYPKMKSTTCLDNYSEKEKAFFLEVGFLLGDRAGKWQEDIRVSVKGKPFAQDKMVLDSIIEELKPLIDPVKISLTNGEGNLVVNFSEDTLQRQEMGFSETTKLSFKGLISKVGITIYSKVKGQARQACMRHEFLHALGLTHPTSRNTGTIIESLVEYIDGSDHVKLYRYSALDKSSLKILYSNCLPVGVKKKTFLKAFESKVLK